MLKTSHPMVRKGVFCIFIVILTFSMMYVFLNDQLFSSDEGEIFVKGQAILQGEILYSEVGSQHMPLMYYLAAVFAWVGADTSGKFRLCFYMLLALLWGLIAYRYSDRFGKKMVLIAPVFFWAILAIIPMGGSILSEHLQAIGMVILGFELLQFRADKPLSTGSCVMISLAVFISFGSAFVSAFAIFVVFVTVMALEIQKCFAERRGFLKSIAYLFLKYWKLIVIVLAPLAAMVLYFWAVGALDDFYGWAYLLNREIYPKYIGGYGSSVLKSLVGGISKLMTPIIQLAFKQSSFMQLLILALAVVGVFCIHHRSKSIIAAVGSAFFLVACATRDSFTFHGIPALAVMAFLGSLAVVQAIEYLQRYSSAICFKRGLAAAVALLILAPFLTKAVSKVGSEFSLFAPNEVTRTGQVVDLLTDEGEGVGFSLLNYEMLMTSHTIPATSTGGSCPWLWEYAGEQVMEELREAPPRVFLFNPNQSTWDYKIAEYAADLTSFINENYASMAEYGYDSLYVRLDYYDQAVEILGFV